jgi:hypothetical protein
MKVTYNRKDIVNQEFQHGVELRLIHLNAMKMKIIPDSTPLSGGEFIDWYLPFQPKFMLQ